METEEELYRRMYLLLFNAITDALEDLECLRNTAAMERLRNAQCQAEELYLDAGE